MPTHHPSPMPTESPTHDATHYRWYMPGRETSNFVHFDGLTFPIPFTVETWVYPISNVAGTYWFSYGAVSGSFHDNCLLLRGDGFTSYGAWHHMVITYDGSTTKVYQDGADISAASLYSSFCGATTGGTLVLGQDQDTSGGSFDYYQAPSLYVDSLAVYGAAWSSARAATVAACVDYDAVDLVSLYVGQGPSGGTTVPDRKGANPAGKIYGGSAVTSTAGAPPGGACL